VLGLATQFKFTDNSTEHVFFILVSAVKSSP
jgi:hypothetical protein